MFFQQNRGKVRADNHQDEKQNLECILMEPSAVRGPSVRKSSVWLSGRTEFIEKCTPSPESILGRASYKCGCTYFPHISGGRDIIFLLCVRFLHLFLIANKSGNHLKATAYVLKENALAARRQNSTLLSGTIDGQLHANTRYTEGCWVSRADLDAMAKRKCSIPVPGNEHRSSSPLRVTILSYPGSSFQCLALTVNRVLCLGLQNRILLYRAPNAYTDCCYTG